MIIIGDAKTELKKLESKSINCCVTSPPYFGLRDYGHENQIGLEANPGEYVKTMVQIFREVSRVLRDDGTLWLNLGDSYAGNGGYKEKSPGAKQSTNIGSLGNSYRTPGKMGLKPKDLIGIPWKVAFALQADGWVLRQDIIWHKPNPMPESVKDRCTKAHEYIFLFSKNSMYYFDYEAIKEPVQSNKGNANTFRGGCYVNGNKDNSNLGKRTVSGNTKLKRNPESKRINGNLPGRDDQGRACNNPDQTHRNKRSVWTVSSKPYKGAHFATFPPDLIEPCILAGCPPEGMVIDPFFGSGTVGQVARENGRDFIGIELNPEYKPLIEDRISKAHYQRAF